MGQTPSGVNMGQLVRRLFKERSTLANVPLDLLGSIVSILEHPVVILFVSIMLNAWLKQVMFASALLNGKAVLIALFQPHQQVLLSLLPFTIHNPVLILLK